MPRKNLVLDKPERLIVFELRDVIPRRKPKFPNLFVSSTSKDISAPDQLLKSFTKSRRKLGSSIVSFREDLCPEGSYSDTKSRGSAKSEFCKKLAAEGYCVNPNPDSKFAIYVVKLAPTAWLKDSRQPVYVGVSSYEPVERIAQHLEGVRSARKVKNHFGSRWEELEPQGRFFHSSYDAVAEETLWGLKLLKDGYKVFGPQGLPNE